MKKSLTKAVATAAAAALLFAGAPAGIANAAPSPVLGVELGVNLDKVVAVDSTYNLADSRLTGISAIKNLRAEMWDKNPRFDRSTLQQVAAANGLNSKSKYVDAVVADENLAYIALQRAIENRAGQISHDRPITLADCTLGEKSKCGYYNSATRNGVITVTENVSNTDVATGIAMTRRELPALNNTNGVYGKDQYGEANGHLHAILDPKFRAYGVSSASTKEGSRKFQYSVLVTSNSVSKADTLPDKVEHKYLYRAAAPGEKPTGVLTTEPPADSVLPNLPGSNDPSSSLNSGSLGNGDNGIGGSLQYLTGGASSGANADLTAQLLQFGITAAVFIGLSALANGVVVHF